VKLNDHIKKGDRWYLRLPGGKTLIHATITDVTESTVMLKSVDMVFGYPSRYEKSKIKFVEKTGHFPPKE